MNQKCANCKTKVKELNQKCQGCGFKIILEPDEKIRARYLRGPALGALFFTQGWTFGAKLYLWFVLSFIPVVGFVALFACLFFGRRWSWEQGGWGSWEEFKKRMRLLDIIATVWIAFLIVIWYITARS